MRDEQLILVDRNDRVLGLMEKMEVHRQGILHRAFSVFVFNSDREMLLQQRALNKYHSAGLWSNACCSHPHAGEEAQVAAQRRLQEEMGFRIPLSKIFDFIYTASFDNGLKEHEFDHVFAGTYNGPVNFNEAEVKDYSYMSMDKIASDLLERPELYTAWFRIAFPKVEAWLGTEV